MHSVNSMIRLLSKISISLASFFFNIYDIEKKKFLLLTRSRSRTTTPKIRPRKILKIKFKKNNKKMQK